MPTKMKRLQRERHIDNLKEIGCVSSFAWLRTLENRTHEYVEWYANGYIDGDTFDDLIAPIKASLTRAFGGELPQGFFINKDPRGYALKINYEGYTNTQPRIAYTDWGDYGIIAPDFS